MAKLPTRTEGVNEQLISNALFLADVEELAEDDVGCRCSPVPLTASIHSFCGCRDRRPELTDAVLPALIVYHSRIVVWLFLTSAIVCLSEKDRALRKLESS
jgi:hypothetical protein